MARQAPSSSLEEAYGVAHRLHQVTEEARRAFDSTASELGLTAPQARLVLRLWEPTPMWVLADHLACDASNVTGIAARLVERELITATPGRDRRIKLLELTPHGRKLRAVLERRIARASPAMTRLSPAQRQELVELLDKLMAPDRSKP